MLCEIEIRSGKPNRFLTLTCNPAIGASPTDRRKRMGAAFPLLMRRVSRYLDGAPVAYWVVTEAHRSGEPHLHAALRCGFVPQKLLSAWWQELTGARIVDIRAVHSERQAARYITKYLAKTPAKFGSSKRYWSSRNWILDRGEQTADEWRKEQWRFCAEHPSDVVAGLRARGFWQVPDPGPRGEIVMMRPVWAAPWIKPPAIAGPVASPTRASNSAVFVSAAA